MYRYIYICIYVYGDGQGGLVCCDSWDRKESDTTEWLIWSDVYIYIWSGDESMKQNKAKSLPLQMANIQGVAVERGFRECMSPLKSGWNLSKNINAARKFGKGLGEEWQAVVPGCVKWGSKSLENLGNSGDAVAWTQWAQRQQLEMGSGEPVVKIFRAWGHVKIFGFYSSMMGVNRKFGTRKWHDGIYV